MVSLPKLSSPKQQVHAFYIGGISERAFALAAHMIDSKLLLK